MKQLYSYYPEFNDNDELLWMVYEQTSDQIVAQFFFEEDAACNIPSHWMFSEI
jgi:IS1 family transposase